MAAEQQVAHQSALSPAQRKATDPLLADCPVVVDVPVWWADLDAFEHVNNTVYFRWFEHARIACFDRLDVLNIREQTGIGPILASTDCRFRIPLGYPDIARVGTLISDLGEDRFTMHYRVVSVQHGKLAAEGSGLIVTFNYREQRKAALPDHLRTALERLGRS